MRMLNVNDSPTVALDASSPAPPPLLTPAAAVGMVGDALHTAAGWSEKDFVARIHSSLLITALFALAYILIVVLDGCFTEDAPAPPPPPHGAAAATVPAAGGPPAWLQKRGLRRIPVVVYEAKPGASATDCVICLGEFDDDGDKVCVLPRCHHVFHVQCIDPWLATHPSCPTCRDSLLIP